MLKIKTANCGHTMNQRAIVTDYYGYTRCMFCQDDDDSISARYCTRLSAQLGVDGLRVLTLTGLPLGVVTERVKNNGARTPTRGRYVSDKMTVKVPGGGTWYANAPKDGSNVIVLRRA